MSTKKNRKIPFFSKNPAYGVKADKDFARRFRTLMGHRLLTLKDISEQTGNAVSTVSTWRNGRLPKNKSTRMKVARIFGVSQSFLYEGKKLDDEIVFSNEAFSVRKVPPSQQMESAIINCVERMIKRAKKTSGGLESLLEKLLSLEESGY